MPPKSIVSIQENSMEKYINKTDKYRAVIEEDANAGFYLYIYDLNSGKCVFDFLQDTLELAKNQAQTDFYLDRDSWVKSS